MLISIRNPFQYLKQIYNSNVNPNQKYLHEMVMLQICILLKIVELTLFVRIHHKGKMCAVMIGDVRKYGKVIPLGFRMMECFLQAGFVNKEIIIKEQHNCRSTDYWETQNNNFLLLAHEYIFVFQK